MEKLNNVDENNGEWNEELNNEYKKYSSFKNAFYKNANLDKEDRFLTRYELRKKYGQDWEKEKVFLNFLGFKKDLQIEQLESLTSWMKKDIMIFEVMK